MLTKSYTAADTFPWKLLRHETAVANGAIRPVHLQLIPTNRCNGGCRWCSCAEVNRSESLETAEMGDILRYFAALGTKAVTFTGGGEPTLHSGLIETMALARSLDMEVGLVTNGLEWSEKTRRQLAAADAMLRWARLSVVRPEGPYATDRVVRFADNLPSVDVGVSFTVTAGADCHLAAAVCRAAAKAENVTHVRFVQDILHPDALAFRRVQEACAAVSRKAVFQKRDRDVPGTNRCLISRLRPLVGADGHVYPCCGVQYAADPPPRKLPIEFRVCHWSQFHLAPPFDGSPCRRCSYAAYNELLAGMTAEVRHERFV